MTEDATPARPCMRSRSPLLALLAVAVAAAGCAGPPDDLVAAVPWRTAPAGLPMALALLPGAEARFVPPPPPEARTAAEIAARAAALTVVAPIVGGIGLAAACTAGAVLCLPVGMVMGLSAATAEGSRAAREDVHSAEEIAGAVAIVQRVVDPARLGACLRDTLVARSGGRLHASRDGTPAQGLRVGLEAITLAVGRDSPVSGRANPELVLSVTAGARLAPGSADPEPGPAMAAKRGDPGIGLWRWDAAPRRYFAATAEEGRALQADLGLAVGILAQRMLADIFPGSVAPPPTRNGADAERFRVACPGLAPAAAAGQTAPTETRATAR